jgi:hypothetical protein
MAVRFKGAHFPPDIILMRVAGKMMFMPCTA